MDSNNLSLHNLTRLDHILTHPVQESCTNFIFYFHTVLIGVLCLLGLAGNTLSLLVLRRDRHNEVAVFLLQVLAAADNALLIVSFVVLTIFVGLISVPSASEVLLPAVPYLKKYLNPLGYMTKCMTVWTTVLLAINRFVAVCKPFAFDRLLTPHVAKAQVFIVLFFSVLLNVPRVFQYDVVVRTNARNLTETISVMTDFGKDKVVEMVYFNILYTTVILGAPVALIVCFNALLIRQLRISMRNLRRNSVSYIGSQEKNITIVMIIIIVEFLICHTPDRIVNLLKLLKASEVVAASGSSVGGNWICPHSLFYASSVSNLLIVFNSSSNFLVYYSFRERFRRILCDQLCVRSAFVACWPRRWCGQRSRDYPDGLSDRVLGLRGGDESSELGNIIRLMAEENEQHRKLPNSHC